jgi:CheY-like chemotaxis protein
MGSILGCPTRSSPTELLKSDSPIYVLVVEDEFLSRLHAVNLVEDAGYKAIEASNSEEAIAILEARKDIRIVFTDVDMPGTMDGLKLAHAIRTRWPPVELIVPQGILILATPTCLSVGDSFRNHIVIKTSFLPCTILSLRLPFPGSPYTK